jgi:sugar phosphate isomerase/epimerase
MKLGVFTPLFATLSFDQMLAKVQAFGLQAIEIGTGAWPGRDHIDPDALLADPDRAREYRHRVEDHGLTISALSCHGNPLHPEPARARADDDVFRKSVRLAERMGVPVVVTFSGCPGDSETSSRPNWVACPWPPEYLELLEWQWDAKVAPYWRGASAYASDHGVKVAIEMHPGFVVYNPESALKLRALAGESIGVNLDPSHLFWQGIDIPAAVRALGPAIVHVHAKDAALDRSNVAVNGVLDVKTYRRMAERSWLFRSVGWGHGELEWKRIVSSLRLAGYDYVISIEHEDALASVDEGLRSAVDLLKRALLTEPPVEAWWT